MTGSSQTDALNTGGYRNLSIYQIKSNQIYLTKGPHGHLHCNTSNIQ